MTDEHHAALSDKLKTIKGMALLSGYPSDAYTDFYKDWRMVSCKSLTNSVYKGVRGIATECLWISPHAQQRISQLSF